jgi:type I restriction enzyme S subunit
MSFPKYLKYKDSGVEWLGVVPNHWAVSPLKSVATHNDEVLEETTGPDEEILYVDISSVNSVSGISQKDAMLFVDAPSRARRRVRDGDVIVSTVRTYLKAIARIRHAESNLIVSTGFAVIRPRPQLVPDFLGYLLTASFFIEQVIARSTGVSYPAINASELVAIPVLVPPLPEQTAIASFLDAETAKIDELVAEQRRLIELLKEKRQAVISHAVTKGLNPNAPMKPSGIEWLGDVPEHWEVSHVRRTIRGIEQGWSPECMGRPAELTEWGVMKSGCVNRGTFNADENKALPEELVPATEYEIRPGDVLVSRASGSPDLVGSTAFIHSVRPRLLLSDKTFRIQFGLTIEPRFFVAAFNSRMMRDQIEQSISGADGLANNLPQAALRRFRIAVPPLTEQAEIVAFLDAETNKLDNLTGEAERVIELLQERRTALISAAVTGKIDVRNFAPQIPEVA